MSDKLERQRRERDVVRDKFPPGTTLESDGAVDGWMYVVTSELGDQYTMFAYWNGSQYRVKMVYPEVEKLTTPHRDHYFRNGDICLDEAVGMATLELAFAKSVLFATAWSVYTRTQKWAF